MTWGRSVLLLVGCVVLGVGVALLITPELGSDGYSTLVYGLALATGWPFLVTNLIIGGAAIGAAWLRGLRPGVGTVTQLVIVGLTVNALLAVLDRPEALVWRGTMTAAALPVLATGIAMYLGSRLGAGPAEAPALAWDPPVPFPVSYGMVQGGGALGGWLMGAPIGPSTLVVILLLGPVVALAARLLRLDISQDSLRAVPSRS